LAGSTLYSILIHDIISLARLSCSRVRAENVLMVQGVPNMSPGTRARPWIGDMA
jgi:hypothetical protein